MRISDWSSDVCSSDLLERVMADQKTFPADFPEIASPSDDTWIVVYGKEAGSAATAAGGKIKVGSLPSGDGGVPDDGTVTAAKIPADTGEQAELGRASCRKEGVSTCRYRWAPAH